MLKAPVHNDLRSVSSPFYPRCCETGKSKVEEMEGSRGKGGGWSQKRNLAGVQQESSWAFLLREYNSILQRIICFIYIHTDINKYMYIHIHTDI